MWYVIPLFNHEFSSVFYGQNQKIGIFSRHYAYGRHFDLQRNMVTRLESHVQNVFLYFPIFGTCNHSGKYSTQSTLSTKVGIVVVKVAGGAGSLIDIRAFKKMTRRVDRILKGAVGVQ